MPAQRHITSVVAQSAALLACGLATLVAVGCRGDRSNKPPRQIFPDMDDSPKVKAQTQSYFFDDERAMRDPVEGAVPFGRHAAVAVKDAAATEVFTQEREDLLRESDLLYRGINPDGSYVERIPIHELLDLTPGAPVDAAKVRSLIALGEKNFNIYCIACHGASGDGDGTVGSRWASPIPSYHQTQYYPGGEKGQDGYIFHVIRNGVSNVAGAQPPLRMPSYAENVSEREAWAVVAYIRSLQQTRRTGAMSAWRDNAPATQPPVATKNNAAPSTKTGEEVSE